MKCSLFRTQRNFRLSMCCSRLFTGLFFAVNCCVLLLFCQSHGMSRRRWIATSSNAPYRHEPYQAASDAPVFQWEIGGFKMNRRNLLKLLSIATLVSAAGVGYPTVASAAEPRPWSPWSRKRSVPWFNILNQGLEEGGKQFNLKTSMTGPAKADPAQQVKLIEDTDCQEG